MASKDDEAYASCGRGRRGELLRAAFQKQARRPGKEEGPPVHDSGRPSGSSSRPDSGTSSGSRSMTPYSDPTPTSSSSSMPAMGRDTLLGHVMEQADSTPRPRLSPTEEVARPGLSSGGTVTSLGRNIVPMPAEQSVIVRQRSSIFEPQVPAAAVREPSGAEARAELPVAQESKLKLKEFRGEAGKPVSMEVNYVRVGTKQGMVVFQYHIDFLPFIQSNRTRCQLLNPVMKRIGPARVFDGEKLYLPHRLPDAVTTMQTVLTTDGSPVTVHIRFVEITPPSQCTHVYNVLFKKVMHCLQLTKIGRNYFDRRGAVLVPQHRLEVWPGHVKSVSEYEGGLLLNCDVSCRTLRSMTAREVLFDVFNAYPQDYKAKAAHAMVGAVVMTRYNNRTYRVDDIAWDMKPTSTYLFHNDETISFADYYKRIYNVEIQDYEQPLLLHRDKPRKNAPESEDPRLACLVPELCIMTGLTDEVSSDFRVMKDVAAHTRLSPSQLQQSLVKYVNNVQTCAAAVKILDEWGVTLEDCGLNIDGRVLPEEESMMRSKTHCHDGAGIIFHKTLS